MQIHSNTLAPQLRMWAVLGSPSEVKDLIRSGKQRRNRKQKSGVTVAIKRKAREDVIDNNSLEEGFLNYERTSF